VCPSQRAVSTRLADKLLLSCGYKCFTLYQVRAHQYHCQDWKRLAQFYEQVLEGGGSGKGDPESSGNTRRNGCLSGTSLRRVRNLALEPQSHSWVRGRRLGGLCHAHPVCCRSGEEADGGFSIVAWCLAPCSSFGVQATPNPRIKPTPLSRRIASGAAWVSGGGARVVGSGSRRGLCARAVGRHRTILRCCSVVSKEEERC